MLDKSYISWRWINLGYKVTLGYGGEENEIELDPGVYYIGRMYDTEREKCLLALYRRREGKKEALLVFESTERGGISYISRDHLRLRVKDDGSIELRERDGGSTGGTKVYGVTSVLDPDNKITELDVSDKNGVIIPRNSEVRVVLSPSYMRKEVVIKNSEKNVETRKHIIPYKVSDERIKFISEEDLVKRKAGRGVSEQRIHDVVESVSDKSVSKEIENSVKIINEELKDNLKRMSVEEEIRKKIEEIKKTSTSETVILPAEIYIDFVRRIEMLGSKIKDMSLDRSDTIESLRKEISNILNTIFINKVRSSLRVVKNGVENPLKLDVGKEKDVVGSMTNYIIRMIGDYSKRVSKLSEEGDYVNSYILGIRLFNLLVPGVIRSNSKEYYRILTGILNGTIKEVHGRTEKLIQTMYKRRIKFLSITDIPKEKEKNRESLKRNIT